MSENSTVTAVCSKCGQEEQVKPLKDGNPRTPMQWKDHLGERWCGSCWHDQFVQRTVTIPVAGPQDGTWDELRQTLHGLWRGATQLANWAVSRYWATDQGRTPDMEKLPPHPSPPYLYPEATRMFPQMDPQSIAGMLRSHWSRYKRARLKVLWVMNESLPTFRWPQPYQVTAQSWHAEIGDDNEALVNLRLGRRRWILRLRGGWRFQRALGIHRRLVSGEAVPAALHIRGEESEDNENRPGVKTRRAGGGKTSTARVVVAISAWVPRTVTRQQAGTLHLRTATDALWYYHLDDDEEVRAYYAGHVIRWIREEQRKNQQLADDLKHEKRWPKEVRRQMVESQEPRHRKYRHRMDTFTHQAAAMIANFAARRRVAQVIYDAADRGWAPEGSFPWFELHRKLEEKLHERRIELHMTTSSEEDTSNVQ